MQNRTGRRRYILAGALIGAMAMAALGSIAWAAIPDADGVIHACYKQSNGALRVIDAPAEVCDASESPLNWSQSGLSGYEVKVASSATDSAPNKGVLVHCSRGKKLLGGGARVNASPADGGGVVFEVAIDASIPAFAGTWIANAHEVVPTDTQWFVQGIALCADLTS
jgi:hypothetical protein